MAPTWLPLCLALLHSALLSSK